MILMKEDRFNIVKRDGTLKNDILGLTKKSLTRQKDVQTKNRSMNKEKPSTKICSRKP